MSCQKVKYLGDVLRQEGVERLKLKKTAQITVQLRKHHLLKNKLSKTCACGE